MSGDPDGWLRERLMRAPAPLRRRIEVALGTGSGGAAEPGGDLAGRLRRVAEGLVEEAKSGPPTRETAVTLLAADALITLACEWTAAFNPAALGDAR